MPLSLRVNAMKRRSRTGGEPIKGRRRKTPEPKRRNTAKAVPRSKSSIVTSGEETEVARLTRELSDERKQRTATSEVLHLLSGSHGDLPRLFNTILTSATKLCQANFGTLSLYEEDAVNAGAKMHRLAGAKMHQRCWQKGPRTGGLFLRGIRLGWDYPPVYPSWPGVSGACSD